MKKKSYALLTIAIICLTIMLSACGVVGGKDVFGVKFLTNTTVNYGGEKVKCFYLDVNEKFNLPYAIYPATATSNAYISFAHNADHDKETTFNLLSNGEFEITSTDFPDTGVQVTITANTEYTDKCLVKLVNYPENCLISNEKDYVNQNGIYPFSIIDNGGNKLKLSDYKFHMESSDNTVLAIENEQELTVRSTGKIGSATISIYFMSDGGKTTLIGEKKLSVIMNSDSSLFAINNYIVENGSELTVSAGATPLDLIIYLFDDAGRVLSGYNIKIDVLSGSSITIVGGKMQPAAVGKSVVEISVDSLDSSGNLVKIRVTINVV